MAFESVASLVSGLCQCRIFTPAQVYELTHTLQAHFTDPRALAWHLLDRGWLTTFQINQLVQGRGAELVLGEYVLLERLGHGSVGQVYKARHGRTGDVVALKVIRAELLANREAVRQFEREIDVTSHMTHPNIVKTLSAGHSQGRHFFAMEYVEGVHLGKMVAQAGPLPVPLACDYVRQAALGLQHAHEHCLIHRDIKPQNLLLVPPAGQVDFLASADWDAIRRAGQARLKILDWGLAGLRRPSGRPTTGDETPYGLGPVGTADFLAPEQARNARGADIRADIYSLGCTFYFLLAGQPPFPGGTMMQKLFKHQQDEPTPLPSLRRDLPARLPALVAMMMAKRPDDRYRTPAGLVADLTPFCDPEALAADLAPPPRPAPAPAAPPAGRASDRRSSVRYTCHLESSCRSIVASTDITWPAEVLDISRGGLALLVDRRFEPGTLLDVDLQAANPQLNRTLLVRVRNVRVREEGKWVLGCSFANELNDEELWAFRAEKVRPPSSDCRAWFRFPCSPDLPLAAVIAHQQQRLPARVLNVSAGGVALQVSCPVEGGTLLRLELQGGPHLPPLLTLARVVHATAQADDTWVLGCAFSNELSDDEMQGLI